MKLATLHSPLQVGVDHLRPLAPARSDQVAPAFYDPARPHNIGDWYLTKIIDRTLDVDELVVLFADSAQRAWDEVNETCDALVLRGGNVIAPDYLSTNVGRDQLERITIPIILFGVGVQDVGADGVPFTADEVPILRRIHDSCASSAVRGDLTAEVLAGIGIHNTVVTGCPTLYWGRRAGLSVRRPGSRRACFTFRQSLFTEDPGPYRAMFRALEWSQAQFDDVVVLLQGEEPVLQRLHQMQHWGAEHEYRVDRETGHVVRIRRTALDEQALRAAAHAAYGRWAPSELIDWMIERSFFSWDIGDHLDLLGGVDLVMGCRLHGNLLALAHGTPTYFLTYDARTRELVDHLRVPACELVHFGESDPFQATWAPAEVAYSEHVRRFRDFLEDNHLDHRLDPLPDATPTP